MLACKSCLFFWIRALEVPFSDISIWKSYKMRKIPEFLFHLAWHWIGFTLTNSRNLLCGILFLDTFTPNLNNFTKSNHFASSFLCAIGIYQGIFSIFMAFKATERTFMNLICIAFPVLNVIQKNPVSMIICFGEFIFPLKYCLNVLLFNLVEYALLILI